MFGWGRDLVGWPRKVRNGNVYIAIRCHFGSRTFRGPLAVSSQTMAKFLFILGKSAPCHDRDVGRARRRALRLDCARWRSADGVADSSADRIAIFNAAARRRRQSESPTDAPTESLISLTSAPTESPLSAPPTDSPTSTRVTDLSADGVANFCAYKSPTSAPTESQRR